MEPKLYRIIFPVEDINTAEKFYSEILKQKGMRVSPGRHYFNLGGTILACYDPKADGDKEGNWNFHENQYIYISVTDLESVRNKMKELDCKHLGKLKQCLGEKPCSMQMILLEIRSALLMKKLSSLEIN